MPKGYKKEWVEKVKAKFNDVQSNKQVSAKPVGIASNDKTGNAKYTKGMVRI